MEERKLVNVQNLQCFNKKYMGSQSYKFNNKNLEKKSQIDKIIKSLIKREKRINLKI